jgi:lysophospholipase L1-like esterase
VRIRLSNAHGDAPLAIGAASVARAGSAAAVVADTLRPVTFDGRPGAVLAPGRDLVSDPVPVLAEAGRALAVSLHLSAVPRVGSVHPVALQTSFLSRPGDFTRTAGAAPFGRRVTSWPLLTGLDVLLPRPTNVLVAIGDSITDGYGTRVDTDQRWTDALFRRLGEAGEPERMAVLNAGLSANQLLADAPRHGGESPITRFGRDVAAVSGVTDVILHIGTNDIAAGRSADEITGGVRWFAERARAAGLRVLLTTITPARGGVHGSRTAVATRNAVNAWIREHGREHADGVVDFAAAVADGSAPSRPAPAYDSGDGLHLSAAGYRALAAAVPLDTLTGSPCRTADPAGTRLLVSGR